MLARELFHLICRNADGAIWSDADGADRAFLDPAADRLIRDAEFLSNFGDGEMLFVRHLQ